MNRRDFIKALSITPLAFLVPKSLSGKGLPPVPPPKTPAEPDCVTDDQSGSFYIDGARVGTLVSVERDAREIFSGDNRYRAWMPGYHYTYVIKDYDSDLLRQVSWEAEFMAGYHHLESQINCQGMHHTGYISWITDDSDSEQATIYFTRTN